MSYMRLFEMAAADVPTPPSGKSSLFIDSATGEWSYKDDTGAVTSLQGPAGAGVPVGGTAGQALTKIDGTDYNTQWSTPVTYTGTAGSIALTGSAFSIDAAYVGQSSITTLGTITTGAWNGTAIGATFGGTGQTSYTTGDIIYASASNVLSKLAAGTNTHVLTMTAGVPVWAAPSGGGGSPGGSTTQVQYNSAGSFAGDATFVFDDTANALSVPLCWTAKGTDIARAATTSIAAATGNFVHLTGTTTITSFGTGTAGQTVNIRFAGAGTLTHNATSLILPGAANITTAANDCCTAVSEGGSNWRVTSYTKASGVAVVVAAATVTGWTPSTNTASPNNTVNAARFLVASASTNADGVIQPKGTGGFLLNLPDSTSTGGNKRGIRSVDLQLARSNAAQVADGQEAFAAGASNTASGTTSAAIGSGNTASNNSSIALGGANNATGPVAIAIGNANTASGNQAVAIGNGNSASGTDAAAIGNACVASGNQSFSHGYRSTDRGVPCRAWASGGFFNVVGDGQSREFVLIANTSNATPKGASTDGAAAGGSNQILLPNNSVTKVSGQVVCYHTTTSDSKSWDFSGTFKRAGTAASTAIIGTQTVTVQAADAGASTWAFNLVADTTNGGISCQVTGEAAHDIAWVIDAKTVEFSTT